MIKNGWFLVLENQLAIMRLASKRWVSGDVEYDLLLKQITDTEDTLKSMLGTGE